MRMIEKLGFSFIFLQILLSAAFGSPIADPEADPGLYIRVEQVVGCDAGDVDVDVEGDDYPEPPVEDPDACKRWSYPSSDWPTICPNYCNHTRQSPININFSTVNLTKDSAGPILFTNYDQEIPTIKIKNNGHSVVITFNTSVITPSISGGDLDGSYTFAQLHFHWGCENVIGSEHTFMGLGFPMELHLVHYKTEYGNFAEAIKHSDGLAVLGVLYKVDVSANPTLQPITDNLPLITYPGEFEDITFNQKLESFVSNGPFFRYDGSLTTPTCNEVVIWTVFINRQSVTTDQLEAFRALMDYHDVHMCNNYREVQPLNGRTVYVIDTWA